MMYTASEFWNNTKLIYIHIYVIYHSPKVSLGEKSGRIPVKNIKKAKYI